MNDIATTRTREIRRTYIDIELKLRAAPMIDETDVPTVTEYPQRTVDNYIPIVLTRNTNIFLQRCQVYSKSLIPPPPSLLPMKL